VRGRAHHRQRSVGGGERRDVLNYYRPPGRLFGKQIPVPGGIGVTFSEPIGVVGSSCPGTSRCPSLTGVRARPGRGCTVVLNRPR
jgi:betaine-aldehyde dehydrogenase